MIHALIIVKCAFYLITFSVFFIFLLPKSTSPPTAALNKISPKPQCVSIIK